MLPEIIEEYLEIIFKLREKNKSVSDKSLPNETMHTPELVTRTVDDMQLRGLIKRNNEGDIFLTEYGEKEATSIVRKHRLLERLLTDVIGLSWDESHDEACRLEHSISPELEEKISSTLGNPETCPHGNPVPSVAGDINIEPAQPLSELAPNQRCTIIRIISESKELLQSLASLGLIPRTDVEILEKAPMAGPILIRVGDSHYALGRDVACKVLVKPCKDHQHRHRWRKRGGSSS